MAYTIPQYSSGAPSDMQVQGLRQFLASQGYDIPDFGNTIGPLMRSALADYVHPNDLSGSSSFLSQALQGHTATGARNPSAWNRRFGGSGALSAGGNSTQVVGPLGATGPQAGGITAPNGTSGDGTERPPGARGPMGSPSGAQGPAGPLGPMPAQGFGPKKAVKAATIQSLFGVSASAAQKLAQQMTDAQYVAPLSELHSQIAAEGTSEVQRQKDIKSWFKQLVGTNKAGTRSSLKGSKGTIREGNALTANILKSLGGGDAAAQVGKASATSNGLLQALEQNNQDYGHNMNSAIGLQGVDARNADAYQSRTTKAGLVSQLLALTQQRGSSMAANLSKATSDLQSQRMTSFLDMARVNSYNAQAQKDAQGSSYDLGKISDSVHSQLGVGVGGTLPAGVTRAQAAAVAAATLAGAGIHPGNPSYQQALAAILAGIHFGN